MIGAGLTSLFVPAGDQISDQRFAVAGAVRAELWRAYPGLRASFGSGRYQMMFAPGFRFRQTMALEGSSSGKGLYLGKELCVFLEITCVASVQDAVARSRRQN
jgi:hypothetical protein